MAPLARWHRPMRRGSLKTGQTGGDIDDASSVIEEAGERPLGQEIHAALKWILIGSSGTAPPSSPAKGAHEADPGIVDQKIKMICCEGRL